MKRNLPFGTIVKPGNTPGGAVGNGLIIDRSGYRSVLIGLAAAAVAADSSITVTIQTGSAADGSDMENYEPDGAPIEATLDTSNTDTFLDVDLTGAEQYIRLVTSSTGTAPSFNTYAVLGDVQYGDGFNA
jgi:hypothetical protein